MQTRAEAQPRVILLLDQYGRFWETTRRPLESLDVRHLEDGLRRRGVRVTTYAVNDYEEAARDPGRYVIYTSSEEPTLSEKDWIEDVLLYLMETGKTLVPRFAMFRAHHNKAFQYLLLTQALGRGATPRTAVCTAGSKRWMTWDTWPAVVKAAAGAGSSGVTLARSRRQLRGAVFRYLRRPLTWITAKTHIRRLVGLPCRPYSVFAGKCIIQEFIPNLGGDYKVLVFGNRYYVLQRDVRPGDFRASGSGRFSHPLDPPRTILEAARDWFLRLELPYASFDIAHLDSDRAVLLEAQFVSFGLLTMETARWRFVWDGKKWTRESLAESPTAEDTFAEALAWWLTRRPRE